MSLVYVSFTHNKINLTDAEDDYFFNNMNKEIIKLRNTVTLGLQVGGLKSWFLTALFTLNFTLQV